jgi:hypothetical protein
MPKGRPPGAAAASVVSTGAGSVGGGDGAAVVAVVAVLEVVGWSSTWSWTAAPCSTALRRRRPTRRHRPS